MSGFAGIVNLDGAPVERAVLDRMTRSLAFRGPDAQAICCEGAVGLGHALLRATHESAFERQPIELDGRLKIIADARIDARAELVQKINAKCSYISEVSLATPDSELILRAFDLWGDSCVDHLLGDFSFAIWDQPRRRLFCARDQFGVKLLYHARIGNALIFSTAVDTLRLFPGFSSVLCDAAIADYLIIGCNMHPALTSFEQILRLPPGHTLIASAGQVSVQRYWTLPIEEPFRYRRSMDYVDEFRELLNAAVADRLRSGRVSVSLSGGLDSPAVAATAAGQLGAPDNVLGMIFGYTRMVADPEPHFARIVAEYLRIPHLLTAIDDYRPFDRCESPRLRYPWPDDITMAAPMCDFMDIVATHGRVLLTGQGGDPGITPSLKFYRGARLFGLPWGVAKYMLTHGHHPRIGFWVTWQRWRGRQPREVPNFPGWLDPGLERRLGLRERRAKLIEGAPSAHPYRPDSYNCLIGAHWSVFFEAYDAVCMRVPVETRHPLFDLRLQRFFLRLPVLPWCADKEILRVGMHGRLPEIILRRPKSPVDGNPLAEILKRTDTGVLNRFAPVPELARYVVRERIPAVGRDAVGQDPSLALRPLNLNYWLSSTFS